MRCLFLFISILFVFNSRASAIESGSLYLGVGAFSHGLFKITKQVSGTTSLLGTEYFPFTIGTAFELSSDVHFAPYLGHTIFGRTPDGGGSKHTYTILSLPLVYTISESIGLEGSAGLALLNYRIEGGGGVKTLNNGSGTAVFASPGGTQDSKTAAVTFGGAISQSSLRASLDFFVEGFTNPDRRTFSVLLGIAYNILGNGI
jgi:hypothetical protein